MKIFIIDDDHLSIFLTKTLLSLENAKHIIKSFGSATEALEVIKEGEDQVPDLILLDLNMPIMDGWDFLEELAPYYDQLYNRCSIYILTSSLDTSDAVRAREYPVVSGLIYKPITSEDIKLLVSQYQTMVDDADDLFFNPSVN